MMRNRSVLTAAVAGVLAVVLGARSAYADVVGADLPLLTALLSNSFSQLTQLQGTLATLRRTYEETRRVAGYADEAYQAFQAFQNVSRESFEGSVKSALDSAFPELGYFRRQASGTGPWAQGTGELQRLFTRCIGEAFGGGSCLELQEALSMQDARRAISATFGPALSLDTQVADYEASVAMAAGHAQEQLNKKTRADAATLLQQCAGPRANTTACQAAGNTAAIRQLEQTAALADQLAEQNRLTAVQIAMESAKRKRELEEEAAHRAFVEAGGTSLLTVPIPRVQATVPASGVQR